MSSNPREPSTTINGPSTTGTGPMGIHTVYIRGVVRVKNGKS